MKKIIIKHKLERFSVIFLAVLITIVWIFSGFPILEKSKINQVQALDVSSGDGLIIYGESGNTTPRWRTYNGIDNNFSIENNALSGAIGLNFTLRTSPTKQEAIAGYVNSAGNLQIMCYNGTSWSNEWTANVGGTGTTRRFDIAYETNSGDVIVLYSTNTSTTNELAYRTKSGTTSCGLVNWSGVNNLNPQRTSGIVHWVKMAWDKRASSNLIAAIWADANRDLSSMIWSGSAWGNEPTIALETSLEIVSTGQDVDDFGLEYESISGDLMVVWANSVGSNGTNGVRYAICTGGMATCTWSAVQIPPSWRDDATNLDISANPNTDEMVFASIGNAGSDLQVGYWSGSAWTNTANRDTSCEAPLAGTKLVATGWLISGATTRSIVAYNDSNATNIGWYVGSGGNFTVQTDWTPTPAFGNPQKRYGIQIDPQKKDRLMFTLSDTNSDLFAKRLIMTSIPTFTWSNADSGTALELNLAQATIGDFAFDYWRYIPSLNFNQVAYRWFDNTNSPDVGSALAVQNTPTTIPSQGTPFRLRMLLHVGMNQLVLSGQQFKLQSAVRSGICDTGFLGESYTDVLPNSGAIRYYDNSIPIDGQNLINNANDPTHGTDNIVRESYEEANNFTNSVAAIPAGQDGKWDFALVNYSAQAGTNYCFRIVKADGSLLEDYTVIPEIITALPEIITVDAVGTQVAKLNIPSNNQYIGGAFILVRNTGSTDVTQIIISEKGTVNANLNLSNVGLYYETATNCSYEGTENLFGTVSNFDMLEKATISGTMPVGTSQVCIYVVLDIGAGAIQGETLEIEISNPAAELTVSAGTVSPASPVSILETTTLTGIPSATWKAAENTPINIGINENIRLRISMANTIGDTARDIDYLLEYASKNGTNCGDDELWIPLPLAANTEHFEMSESVYFENGDSTVARLSNPEDYNFVPGKMVEKPSNSSGILTLPVENYTEIEFVFQANINASGIYCFRVTKSGIVLDEYSNYPELEIIP